MKGKRISSCRMNLGGGKGISIGVCTLTELANEGSRSLTVKFNKEPQLFLKRKRSH